MAIILDQYSHLQLIQPHYRLIAFIVKATALPRTPLASKPRTKGQLRAWSSEGGSSWTGPRWGKWCWRSLPAWTRRCRWTAAARTEPEKVEKEVGIRTVTSGCNGTRDLFHDHQVTASHRSFWNKICPQLKILAFQPDWTAKFIIYSSSLVPMILPQLELPDF